MESHLVRIINRLEMMAADGGNSKRNFEREGVVVAQRKTSCFKIVFRKGRKDKRANLQTAKEGRRNTYCIPDSGT